MNPGQPNRNGLCRLCPQCAANTHTHFLNEKLLVSYCDCEKVGGIYIGFCSTPYWKLFSQIDKGAFYQYAKSAGAYVDCIRDAFIAPLADKTKPNLASSEAD